jgi:transcriptional regulator with XRE-family HTH domain
MGRTNATACYRELGAELKKRREAAGLTGDDVARSTGWHRSKVSRVEQGHAEISAVDLLHYLGACRIFAAEAHDLLAICREAERKLGFWVGRHARWMEETGSSLIYHEATAARSVSFEPLLVPGLLQTPDYARILLAEAPMAPKPMAPKEVDALLRTRVERQQVLHRPKPARFVFFVHEQALRLRVGSRAVMHEQLLHLVIMAGLPHVQLRVVPSSAGERAVFGGPFRLFEFTEHRPLVFLDGVTVGLFLEDAEYVAEYRALLPELHRVALGAEESRSFAAGLADALDRGSRRNGAIYQLEEEQLQ